MSEKTKNPYPTEGKTISNLGFLQGCAWNEGHAVGKVEGWNEGIEAVLLDENLWLKWNDREYVKAYLRALRKPEGGG